MTMGHLSGLTSSKVISLLKCSICDSHILKTDHFTQYGGEVPVVCYLLVYPIYL
jgi:hypothetical protein